MALDTAQAAKEILEAIGGPGNVVSAAHCATRLRLELRDVSVVDERILKSAGAKGVIKPGKNSVQVIIGLKVQAVADAMRSRR